MTQVTPEPTAESLMEAFAKRTGLTSSAAPQRYLWTDAFAVCNFLELSRQRGDPSFQNLALQLVDQVHRILGRHRPDDPRSGWISGLDEQDGAEHPTAGGLRIGKPLGERDADDPLNERSEWDRDGQYFHYLTKWTHALHRVSQVTDDLRFERWAIELAKTAHSRFTYQPAGGGPRRMYWKMSIDLSRPLVASQGQHDPLDGLITWMQLREKVVEAGFQPSELAGEIEDFFSTGDGQNWASTDPLGLGGLLMDVFHVAQLNPTSTSGAPQLLQRLVDAASLGLASYVGHDELQRPAEQRLGFRELGLAIGLRGVQRLQQAPPRERSFAASIERLGRHQFLADQIEAFWRQPAHRQVDSWTAHRDINEVMLATNLAPDGYFGPAPG